MDKKSVAKNYRFLAILLSCMVAGALLGWFRPKWGHNIAFLGTVFINMMFCVVVPLVFASIAPELRALAHETDEITEHLSKDDFQANVCLNYGGRDEILRAVRRFAAECAEGKRKPEDLDETLFSTYLDSAGIPDPELIIRPSGEQRLSNFLLWQCAYSEFYYTDALWPDFDEEELDKAIAAYQSRDRRFGGVKK